MDEVRAWFGEAWRTATTPQPVPDDVVVLGAAALVVVVLLVPGLWRVARNVLTIVHEAGHALVAVLTGRRLQGIRLHSDTSGLTVSVGRPRGPGMVATAFAGYPAPAVLGLGASWLLGRGYAVGVLWVLLVALALLLVQIRNLYGLWAVLVSGVLLWGVTTWAPAAWQVAVAYVVTWFLLLGAPRAVVELQVSRSRERRRGVRRGASDADVLAGLTRVPGLVWVGVFLLVCVAAAVVGGAWIVGLPLR
ncbi:M50 family metallopeptidase [Cellulomonas carbonis]|uniref:Membrane protein n=1 Tax=Cellulomonas carbonis T26 TaxID=947969 RepID=A0A0A0BRG2_9CELL|nr:M50 family metallopeptidase [Cellulomonas carbonis]KGM10545.1 membrane protein [Cellulomonas carbonis T26]GGC02191.1 membrane protein [Cellulomonas carbonis]